MGGNFELSNINCTDSLFPLIIDELYGPELPSSPLRNSVEAARRILQNLGDRHPSRITNFLPAMNPYLASPLYFDPRIFPHTGHGQSRARQHRKCEANGTNCNNRSISDVIRGELVRSLYCEYHHCRMVEGGRMCRVAKAPRNERYCNEREYLFLFFPLVLIS